MAGELARTRHAGHLTRPQPHDISCSSATQLLPEVRDRPDYEREPGLTMRSEEDRSDAEHRYGPGAWGKSMEAPPTGTLVSWDFRQSEVGTWTWQRTNLDGSVTATSTPHKNIGSVIADAMAAGFRPGSHRWVIEDDLSITHFAPGQEPQILGK